MTDIKKGDRVRVVIEGAVTYTSHPDYSPKYIVVEGEHEIDLTADTVVVEKIDPPVEVFKPGDVVRHRDAEFTVTITEVGYLIHHTTGGHTWCAEKPFADQFTSEYYEKVNLAEVPF